jgi:hypothetical protein
MERRDFIVATASGLFAAPLAAGLHGAMGHPPYFRSGLYAWVADDRSLGWVSERSMRRSTQVIPNPR